LGKIIDMENPNTKTKVVHSKSKKAWNVIGTVPGKKYKIARVPYLDIDDEYLAFMEKVEAFRHAEFISYCFNNSDKIIKLTTNN